MLHAAFEGVEHRPAFPDPIPGDACSRALARHSFEHAFTIGVFGQDTLNDLFDLVLRKALFSCEWRERSVIVAQPTDFEYHSYLETV